MLTLGNAMLAVAEDRPCIWARLKPSGSAYNKTYIHRMVRSDVSDWSSGVSWHVDQTTNKILGLIDDWDTGYYGDPSEGKHPVCILLEGFGMGARKYSLMCNPLDAITDSEDPNRVLYYETPWMSNGIDEVQGWMQSFVNIYRTRQYSDPNIPDPTRYSYDTEYDDGFSLDPWTMSDNSWELWNAICADNRWSSEDLVGYGLTLSELYSANNWSANTTPSRNVDWADPVNQEWSKWWEGIAYGMLDAAMNEAAYVAIHSTWPLCSCTNYMSSMSTDGQGSPLRERIYIGSVGTWFHSHWQGSSDLQAPYLYGVSQTHCQGNESPEEATLRVARTNIENCLTSFGGMDPSTITPWIGLPGWTWLSATLDKDDVRQMMAMLRSKGIREMFVYEDENSDPNSASTSWNQFDSIVDQVWGTDIASGDVISGNHGAITTDLSEVEFSDNWDLNITAVNDGTKWKTITELYVDPEDPNALPERLRVHLEAKVANASADVTAKITIRKTTGGGSWEQIGSDITLDDSGAQTITYYDLIPSGGLGEYLTANDQYRLRVTYTCLSAGFQSKTNLIQVIGSDDD
jgi:hypothetical protein